MPNSAPRKHSGNNAFSTLKLKEAAAIAEKRGISIQTLCDQLAQPICQHELRDLMLLNAALHQQINELSLRLRAGAAVQGGSWTARVEKLRRGFGLIVNGLERHEADFRPNEDGEHFSIETH